MKRKRTKDDKKATEATASKRKLPTKAVGARAEKTQLSTDDLREIAKFLSRWDLDALPLTSRRFRPITNAMTHVCLRALDHTRFTYALGHIYSRNRFHVEVAVGGDTVYKEDLWESELIEALAPRFRSAAIRNFNLCYRDTSKMFSQSMLFKFHQIFESTELTGGQVTLTNLDFGATMSIADLLDCFHVFRPHFLSVIWCTNTKLTAEDRLRLKEEGVHSHVCDDPLY